MSSTEDLVNSITTNPRNDLCLVCKALNISPHKFSPTVEELPLMSAHGFDTTGLEAIQIGFLDEFYRRRNSCPFCCLVYDATHGDDVGGIGHDGLDRNGQRVACWLDWQLDGRLSSSTDSDLQVKTKSNASTRRLRLFSKTNAFQTSYLVPRDTTGDRNKPTFRVRELCPEQVDLPLLRSWLQTCEDCHEQCFSAMPHVDDTLKLRVIDVSLMCIAEIAPSERYCTLSYCWGTTPQPFLLKRANLLELMTPGVFAACRPSRTVSDAIKLMSDLGEKYLWVDGQCIVQDDDSDWTTYAQLMDKIYSNSVLTICAASGGSSDYGLPGSQTASRSLVQSSQNCNGLQLVVIKSTEERIKASPWNDRAWTFQERVLSRRCLIFVDDRVLFQCRQATWLEELNCETTQPCWTLDMIGSPLALFNEFPLRRYSRSVELYSARHLTFLSDRLVAFEGIASSLATGLQPGSNPAHFYYGLPASHFDWAVLWEPKTDGKRTTVDQRRGVFFPSWSWCGWTGTAEWRMSTTSGTLLHLHEWLMNHTWIIWYIGTDCGHHLVHSQVAQIAPGRGRWEGYSMPRSHDRMPDSAVDDYGRIIDGTGNADIDRTAVRCHKSIEGHLNFFTWSAFFTLSRKSMSDASFKSSLQPGLHRFSVVDSRGDWCGTTVLNDKFFSCVGGIFEFIAISEAKDFSMEEYDSWTYYVPAEREEAEWYLYYALMIRWNKDKTSAERLGLAKIYQTAFQSGSFDPGVSWKEITLG